ncbi:hypothetical protein V8G54_035810, partial [Vigna mungo]
SLRCTSWSRTLIIRVCWFWFPLLIGTSCWKQKLIINLVQYNQKSVTYKLNSHQMGSSAMSNWHQWEKNLINHHKWLQQEKLYKFTTTSISTQIYTNMHLPIS